MPVGGFILVGGESSRMGRDKARLPFQSRLLVEHIAAQLVPLVDQVILIGHPERYSDLNFQCLPDSRPNMGPLAGIETALLSRRAEWNVITACDMPLIGTQWLERLLDTARKTGAPCVVTRDAAGVLQPLCGVYRNTCLPYVRAALDARRLRLTEFVAEVNAQTVDIPAIVPNLNTPEEWALFTEDREARVSESA